MVDDIAGLRRILAETRTIAMVGLSGKWYRPSYFAAKYLQDHGYRVIPVNPGQDEILGERCYAQVEDIPVPIDVVDIFQRPEKVMPHVEAAIEVGARVVWMQLGIVNEDAAAKAEEAGLEVVMDRCMKIEHARLFGGINFVGVNTGVVSSKRPHYVAN